MPSDVEQFYNIVQQFAANDPYGSFDKNEMYKISALSNRVIQNSKYMDKAVEQATNNDALEQYAVDQRGFVYTMDSKGNISSKSLSTFDAQKDRALTISELINFRRFSPEMAQRTDVINTVGNSIGMTKINDYILKIIEKVGKATSKQEAYIDVAGIVGQQVAKEPSSAQKAALEQAYKEMSYSEGTYLAKLTQESTSKNVNDAFNYIYSVLPKNMKAALEATYIINGGKKTSNYSYSADIIKQALLMNNEVEEKRELSNPFKLDGGASGKSHRLSAIEVLLNSDVNRTDWVLAEGEDQTGITFHDATVISGIPTLGNHPAGTVPLRMALDAGMGSFLDYSQIYFGDQKVSSGALSKAIVGNNNSGVVYAPIDSRGNLDFSRRDAFEKAEKEIADNPNIYVTDQQKTLAHRKEGSPATYKNGKLSTEDGNVGKFFVTMATTSDDIVDDANRFERKLKGDQEDQFKDMLEEIYSMDSVIKSGYENPFGWFSDYYTVPVFIKVNEHAAYDASYYQGHGPLEQSVNSGYIQQQQLEQKTKPVYGSSQALFNYGK